MKRLARNGVSQLQNLQSDSQRDAWMGVSLK